MTQLRDYQQDLLEDVQARLIPEQARVMLQLPTGGGKTIIAGALLNGWLSDGRKAVWLTHRKELAAQTREMLGNVNVSARVDAQWNPGDDAPARGNGVAILMAQTVSRRTARMEVWRNYDRDDLMIIDEAHHAAAEGWTRAMHQWPGRILGMTATPWRLSEKEGFDHLFSSLLCGPQVLKLQSGSHLCDAQVRMPSSEWVIQGGAVGMTGDYTDSGIEAANQNNIMTAGALKFWQEHALDRQTIVYAVSVNHAHNLAAVFRDANVPTAVILGETESKERAGIITAFKYRMLKVLVNVAVATEGFDLPDASCVVITRPTKSLTLYLQMVGRGLRPKENGGNCLILDLAANSELHGLPAEVREWTLEPRGAQEGDGDALTIWCDRCKTLSPAASHTCQNCGAPFGKDCNRCGTWRAWKRWRLEIHCEDAHELVCDLCHRDAHIEAHLPIDERLESILVELEERDPEMQSREQEAQDFDHVNQSLGKHNNLITALEDEFGPYLFDSLDDDIGYHYDFFEMSLDELSEEHGPELDDFVRRWRLYWLLREFLEEEKTKATAVDRERKREIREAIEFREAQLADDLQLDTLFGDYVESLADDELPQNKPQEHRMFAEWENGLRRETNEWKDEFARLDNQPIDKSLVFNRAIEKVVALLRRAAQDVHLLPDAYDSEAQIASQTRKGGKGSDRGRSKNKNRPYGASKSTATHPEQFKELALRLFREGNNARQVAEELFANDFGTRAGRMIGPGQMAQMLKRWNSEPDLSALLSHLGRAHTTNRAFHDRGFKGDGTIRSTATHRKEIVTMSTQLRESGLSYQKISDELWKANFGTKEGYQFGAGQVRDIVIRSKGRVSTLGDE